MQELIDRAVGILGGIGPLATVYFMELVIRHTCAEKDQDHINMVVLNHATIPDRTDFILGKSTENPLEIMIEDAKKLEAAGAGFIVMPCNTAHYFYDEIRKNVKVEMVSIIEETVRYALETVPGLKKLGILATDGTIRSGTYDIECARHGISCQTPADDERRVLMRIIYDEIKAGKPGDMEALKSVIGSMRARGCDAVVLGCTELSTMCAGGELRDGRVVDSLYALAKKTILLGGKRFRKD